MAKRDGHIGQAAQRRAVEALCKVIPESDGAQNGARSGTATSGARA